jgi:uncharacterized UBP type Zn finger protein
MKRARQRREARVPASSCAHLEAAATVEEPQPLSSVCQECAEDGRSNWAHLRMCLACRHVGCCDSSPHQHATAHFNDTGHPVMRSIEPDESWRWCYVDLELRT